MAGPLSGLTIVELAGIGPGPMCSMMLGDMGADVIRVDRTKSHVMDRLADPKFAVHNRSRRSVSVDLQKPEGIEVVMRLIAKADGMTEPFRPGVAERLGVGPEVCLARNPKLVYGRMTGWGQRGPMAQAAGHDIDYIALAGALEPLGRAGDRPLPALNLIGDFGGGGMLMAFGMVAAIISAQRTGEGQVVDAAMVDGAASLMTMTYTLRASGMWNDVRGTNLLDTGAHFYEVYETSDGGFIGVGAIEPQFYAELIRLMGLDDVDLSAQMDRDTWPAMKDRFALVFAAKTRKEWEAIFEGSEACAAPVLSLAEAPDHPHNKFRETFIEVAGVVQPSPSPRFEGTPGS